jgi:shikimate kinase
MSASTDAAKPDDVALHIVLVGLMGTGKSSVGRHIAATLQRTFVDTDKRVEAVAGKSVREIFEQDGEMQFRSLEAAVVEEVLDAVEPTVIAAAGGVVTQERNRATVLRHRDAGRCVVVWLRADINELLTRVRKGAHRPLLDQDPSGTLTAMASERAPYYEQVSSVVVDTDGKSISDVASDVLKHIGVRS